ncbi:MAG: hypothetical protein PHQ35_10835 [Phycisphaerae bacterium]|nr:hypothetical protein [Phycisphaerae bacterium]
MENNNNNETKPQPVFFKDAKFMFSAFLAGTGAMLWIMNFVFSPLTVVKQDIALIRQDINTIQLNHEKGMENALKELADMEREEMQQRDTIITLQKEMIRLQTIHGLK